MKETNETNQTLNPEIVGINGILTQAEFDNIDNIDNGDHIGLFESLEYDIEMYG